MSRIDDITSHGGLDFVPFRVTYQIPISQEALSILRREDDGFLERQLLAAPNIRAMRWYRDHAVGPCVEVEIKTCVNFDDQLRAIASCITARTNQLLNKEQESPWPTP